MTSTPLADHSSKVEDNSSTSIVNNDKEKTVMPADLERVQKVIQRFKDVIIELSSLANADVRIYSVEELQAISAQMCIAINELTHMTNCTEEVFTADDFMIIARKMPKKNEVRKTVLIIFLRGHRALLETIAKCINAESLYSEKSCAVIEAAVAKMESIVPRASVYKPSFWDCCCGSS